MKERIDLKNKKHLFIIAAVVLAFVAILIVILQPLVVQRFISIRIKKLQKQMEVLAQEKLGVPKTAPEQLIVKLKETSSIRGKSDAAKKDFVRSKAAKYVKVKSVKKQLTTTEAELNKRKKPQASQLQEIYTLQIENGQPLAIAKAQLQEDPSIESVQWNYRYEPDAVPNDPGYSSQWVYPKTGATAAWDLTTGSPSVVIAVIGTGVKWDHEDLAANIWSNTKEIPGNGIDDDGNGFIDDTRGWNFELNNNNPTDDDGHDTSVAGVAAAVGNNSKGIAGVCWQCKIMPLRADLSSTQVAAALYYAVNNGAKIVNMSFGSYYPGTMGPDTVVGEAVSYGVANGVMMIATAGNNSINTKRYPGALDNVVGVSATDSNDNRAGFSNWGDWVDVAAPGASIYSTTLSGYGYVNGTSFAAPYVAGVAGLLFSRFPSISVQDARLLLEYTVDKITTDKPIIGSGRINTYRSILSSSRPGPFAIIKRPWNDDLLSGSGLQEIWGTALGDSYVVDYQLEGGTTWTQIGSGRDTVNGTLARLDLGTLSPNTTYFTLRLRVTKGSQNDSHLVTVAFAGGFHAGFPQQLFGGPILSPATVSDIDQDGDLEIIVGTNNGEVFVLNQDGTPVPGWPRYTASPASPYVFGAPAVGDIDGDGHPEIVTTTYGGSGVGGYVSTWHRDGTVVSGWPKNVGQMRGAAALANLDSDPALEIVVAAEDGKVYAWKGNGSLLSGWPYTLPDSNVQTAPAIGDVDNDGSLEIVVATSYKLVVLKANGSLLASWYKSAGHSHPVLSNLDVDGDLEIVVAGSSAVSAYEYTGTLLWTKSVSSNGYNQLSVGDINSDLRPEVLFAANSYGASIGKVYAWNSDGVLLAGWPKDVAGVVSAEPTIGDVDGDGVPDVVVPTEQGRVYAWDKNGSIIPGFPKPTGSPVYRAATIVDLDGNGRTELIAGDENGELFVWDLPGKYNASKQPWPFSRHDVQNTGRLVINYPIGDTDGDGCKDTAELGTDRRKGGQRDPNNPWDFYDVPVPAIGTGGDVGGKKDKAVNMQDVLAVSYYKGTYKGGPPNANGVSYDSDLNGNGIPDGVEYDRSPSQDPSKPWLSGPPDGRIDDSDVNTARLQFGDSCLVP